MEKSEHELIANVGRLNARKAHLENEIKGLERRLDQITETCERKREEIKDVDDQLQPLRDEQQNLSAEIAALKKSKKSDVERVTGLMDELRHQKIEFEERKRQHREAVDDFERSKASSKQILTKIERTRDEAESIRNQAEDLQAQIKAEETQSREALEIDRQKIAEQQAALRKKQRSLDHQKNMVEAEKDIVRNNAERLDRLEQRLSAREKHLSEKAVSLAGREAECDRRESESTQKELSLRQEKSALRHEKDMLELEQLRFKKLIRQKNLEEELNRLRDEIGEKN